MDNSLIRNFSIIAHIDHGKSTLADRIMEHVGAIDKRHFHAQMLDDMDLERERGITIKASSVQLNYKSKDGKTYTFNLIDTPGHVDFTYEVSKSLTACEGALLVVDATQGVEAQTVANYYLAKERKLKIIPVINKIDLPSADIERVKKQIVDILRLPVESIILASAKEGLGIDDILERVISDVPAPIANNEAPLQALVFDSVFDSYRGVIIYTRIVNGTLKKNTNIKLMQTGKTYNIIELGVLKDLKETPVVELISGNVGYVIANIKQANEVVIGDTIADTNNSAPVALSGYKQLKHLVFCGIYPVNAKDFDNLKDAIEKLKLSDASFIYTRENSQSFGFGFRCGFLGLLHMEIVQERLEREYNLNLILTTPNVVYRVVTNKGEVLEVDNPLKFPAPQDIKSSEEPFVLVNILIPTDTIDNVCELTKSRRGIYRGTEYLEEDLVRLTYEMPLSEIIVDFYDKIKSLTRGYGSIDYEFLDYYPTKLVKLDIALNGNICDAFSCLVPKEKAHLKGKGLVEKLKELIPRQLFEVKIQATVGAQIVASERVSPVGKNVTAKCYGGDITRKRKLWEKQKEGKKRLKQFGTVEIPQEAFLEVLRIQ
ncbi:MAG: translation elongation factor 4 [Candidatus Omnitrophota bacterium]